MFDIGAVDMGAIAIGFDKAGKFNEGHFFEEVDLQKTIIINGERGAHVVAAIETSVAEGAEEHVTIEKWLTVYFHADIVTTRGKETFDDAGSVRMFAPNNRFATHIVTRLAHHGIEAEITYIDAVPKGRLSDRIAIPRGILYAHDINRVGGTLHQAGNVVEVINCTIVFDVIVATAVGVDGDLHVVETDATADHLVKGTIAATGIESDLFVGVGGAPLAHPSGGISWILSVVNLVVEPVVQGGVGLNFMGEYGGGILPAGTRIDNKDVFHLECKITNNN